MKFTREPTLCPYCRRPLAEQSVTLWDDRQYCQVCVREVSPELLELALSGAPLEDVVTREDVSVWNFMRFILPYVAASTLALGAYGVSQAFGGEATLFDLLLFPLQWFGACILFFFLIGLLAAEAHRSGLPRRVSVRDGVLSVRDLFEERSYRSAECVWHTGRPYADPFYMFTRFRRMVLIQPPVWPGYPVAVGASRADRQIWRSFLTLSGARQVQPLGWLPVCFAGLAGGAVGWCVGAAAGWAATTLAANGVWPGAAWADDAWRDALVCLGAFDGGFTALLVATAPLQWGALRERRWHQIWLAGAFGATGALVGLVGGAAGALACGVGNSLVGLGASRVCRGRIRAAGAKNASPHAVADPT